MTYPWFTKVDLFAFSRIMLNEAVKVIYSEESFYFIHVVNFYEVIFSSLVHFLHPTLLFYDDIFNIGCAGNIIL